MYWKYWSSKNSRNNFNRIPLSWAWKCVREFFFLLYKKLCECNSIECNSVEKAYYQRNRDVILNRAKDYYENDKKRLTEQARYKYRNLSEEEKTKKENMEKIYIIICLKKRNKD